MHWQVEWLLLLPDGHLPELTQRNRGRTAVQPVSLDVRKQEMLQFCHPPRQAETPFCHILTPASLVPDPVGEPVQLGALTEILPTEGETLICLFFPPHQWVQLALYRTGQDLRRRKRSSTDLDGCSVWQMPLQEKLSKAGKLSFYLWESSEKNAGVLIKKHHCKWNL